MTRRAAIASPLRDPDPTGRNNLERMTVRRLVAAYFAYPTVIVYELLAATSLFAAWRSGAHLHPIPTGAAIVTASVAYPVIWYVLHRFVLHSRRLYRNPLTARLWKRIHYDHHQSPHRMDVLFGSLAHTLPTIAGSTLLIGGLIGGPGAAFAALATGLITTLVYEFCHCVQHLNIAPKNKWLMEWKRLHMAHHFHDETGNFGIIAFWPDRLLGTHYAAPADRPRSATVFNLGYDDEQAILYPWVAKLSGGSEARIAADADGRSAA